MAFPNAEIHCLKNTAALKTAESQMMLLISVLTEGFTKIDSPYSLQKKFFGRR